MADFNLAEKILSSLHSGVGEPIGLTTFVNPFSYRVLRRMPEVAKALSSVHLDGISGVILCRAFGIPAVRLSFDFTSVATEVFSRGAESGAPFYFVGSTEEQIQIFSERIREIYPAISIAGSRNGYFSSEEEVDSVYSRIIESGAAIVIVGMGAGKQETFGLGLLRRGFRGLVYTCGGFFHQTSMRGAVYYPAWVDRFNLRWLYRIWDEPKLFRRYALDYPAGLSCMVIDLIRFRVSRHL